MPEYDTVSLQAPAKGVQGCRSAGGRLFQTWGVGTDWKGSVANVGAVELWLDAAAGVGGADSSTTWLDRISNPSQASHFVRHLVYQSINQSINQSNTTISNAP